MSSTSFSSKRQETLAHLERELERATTYQSIRLTQEVLRGILLLLIEDTSPPPPSSSSPPPSSRKKP